MAAHTHTHTHTHTHVFLGLPTLAILTRKRTSTGYASRDIMHCSCSLPLACTGLPLRIFSQLWKHTAEKKSREGRPGYEASLPQHGLIAISMSQEAYSFTDQHPDYCTALHVCVANALFMLLRPREPALYRLLS